MLKLLYTNCSGSVLGWGGNVGARVGVGGGENITDSIAVKF